MCDNNRKAPTLGEAVEIVREIVRGEEEAGTYGTAYLDPHQLDALREVLALAEDVVLGDIGP